SMSRLSGCTYVVFTTCKRMLFRWLMTAASIMMASMSLAEERLATLQVGSETYSNVVITEVTATDIYFSHGSGFGNAKLKRLTPELQKKFHSDAAKASEQE